MLQASRWIRLPQRWLTGGAPLATIRGSELTAAGGLPPADKGNAMHYPKRLSRIKRKRTIGLRARMRTASGRKLINRKRRLGRTVSVA